MRGMTLEAIGAMAKAEAMQSVGAAQQPAWTENTYALIAGIESDLALYHPWPFLERRDEVPLAATGRFFPLPSGVLLERITGMRVRDGGEEYGLEYGIGAEQYRVYDSAAGITSDYARRWHYWLSDGEKVEIWPVPPAGSPQVVTITSKKVPTPMAVAGDTSTLDGRLLALFAAASLASGRGGKDADGLQAKANTRLHMLLNGNTPGRFISPPPVLKAPTSVTPTIRVR